MVQVTEALLAEMVQAIIDAADPEQVILFGSRGRGKGTDESDVDFLVVESEPFGEGRSRRKRLRELHDAVGRFRVSTDILL